MLGAVNPKDGSIIWRQRLVDNRSNVTGKTFLSAADGDNTIYSAVNGGVHAWDAADGRLVWDWRGMGSIKALEVIGTDDGPKDVLILSEEGKIAMVKKLAADTGDVIWELTDDR